MKEDPREPLPPKDTTAPCNPELLAPYNSYGAPRFVYRGYYVDEPFKCASCGEEGVWRATQQKWWYEVAKGHVEERRDEARRVHLEGVKRKREEKEKTQRR